MHTDLKDKVILITGASTGIGAAAAHAFGRAGAAVAVHYNSSETAARSVAADIIAGGAKAATFQADATREADLIRLVANVHRQFGRIDVLINNAGNVISRKPFAESDSAFLSQMLDLNVRSVFTLCQAVLPIFRTQGQGNIINVTSIAARNGGGPGVVLYAAAKGFVSTLTRGLAKELVPLKVRVNGVAPGVILTPLHARHTPQATLDAMQGTVPMGRLGTAEECAGAFLFLASEIGRAHV